MPELDKNTSSDAPGGSKVKPRASLPDPTHRIREALQKASAVVTGAEPNAVANAIRIELDTFLRKLLPPPPCPIPADTCDNTDPQIAPFCHQLKLSMQQAKINYENSKAAASASLASALGQWSMAMSEYEFAMANADSTMRRAVSDATINYDTKNNPDSYSRSLYLYFSLKQAATAAIQAYETSATSDGSTLAGAAGDLLAAYQAYLGAINAAQSQRLNDKAVADQTFWQSVEAARVAL